MDDTRIERFGEEILEAISGYHGGIDRLKWNYLERKLRLIVQEYAGYESGEWLKEEEARIAVDQKWVVHDMAMLLRRLRVMQEAESKFADELGALRSQAPKNAYSSTDTEAKPSE